MLIWCSRNVYYYYYYYQSWKLFFRFIFFWKQWYIFFQDYLTQWFSNIVMYIYIINNKKCMKINLSNFCFVNCKCKLYFGLDCYLCHIYIKKKKKKTVLVLGWYMTVEASRGEQNSYAALQSPAMKEASNECLFEFYYHMFGEGKTRCL